MKSKLAFSILIFALLRTQSAASETIAFQQITATTLFPLSVANGVTADEVSELLGEFEGVSVFENKRMLQATVDKIVADSSYYNHAPTVSVEVAYLMPVSQFDFESSSFAVCLPRVMFAEKDIPLKSDLPVSPVFGAFEYQVSDQRVTYKKRDGHSRVAQVSGDDFNWVCKNGDIMDSVEFVASGFSVVDVSQAEKFDTIVSQAGDGFVFALLTCDLVSFTANGIQLHSYCQAKKLQLYSIDDYSVTTPLFDVTYSNP